MGITYAQFRSGRPVFMPYAPPSVAVNAGDIVIIDNVAFISHLDIAVGYQGELATMHGVYILPANGAISVGSDVYWDPVNFLVTPNPLAGCVKLGMLLAGPTGLLSGAGPVTSGDLCYVLHQPGNTQQSIGASTAAAGNAYTNAGTLPSGCKCYPTTASDGTKGVSINILDQLAFRQFYVGNGVSNHPLVVYPPVGSSINGAATNAGYTGASGEGVWCTCLSSTGPWFCS
jgi:predicted RecA/RadA family phage recombinase